MESPIADFLGNRLDHSRERCLAKSVTFQRLPTRLCEGADHVEQFGAYRNADRCRYDSVAGRFASRRLMRDLDVAIYRYDLGVAFACCDLGVACQRQRVQLLRHSLDVIHRWQPSRSYSRHACRLLSPADKYLKGRGALRCECGSAGGRARLHVEELFLEVNPSGICSWSSTFFVLDWFVGLWHVGRPSIKPRP